MIMAMTGDGDYAGDGDDDGEEDNNAGGTADE